MESAELTETRSAALACARVALVVGGVYHVVGAVVLAAEMACFNRHQLHEPVASYLLSQAIQLALGLALLLGGPRLCGCLIRRAADSTSDAPDAVWVATAVAVAGMLWTAESLLSIARTARWIEPKEAIPLSDLAQLGIALAGLALTPVVTSMWHRANGRSMAGGPPAGPDAPAG